MVARNDITGDAIQTKSASQSYRDNFDTIFRKNRMSPKAKDNGDDFGTCGCGRSPSGKCVGWHGLTEDQYQEALEKYLTNQEDTHGKNV